MTPDLLGRIFSHLCDPGALPLRHLLFVSKGFHDATVNNTHLWASISLDSSFAQYFSQRPEEGNRFIEQCLHRSGSLPLCIYIVYDKAKPDDLTFLLGPLQTLGNPEWKGFERCVSLVWGNNWRSFGPQTLMPLLPKRLPSLQRISLSRFGCEDHGYQLPDCPALKNVTIYSLQTSHTSFWGTTFEHVTSLTFGAHTDWIGHDVTMLSLFPALYHLTLFTRVRAHSQGVVPLRPILFQHLRTLTTQGDIPSVVFTKLTTLVLEELHIEANIYGNTSIVPLLDSPTPRCLRLYALLPKAVLVKEQQWATNLLKLVQRCTRLEDLYVSRWMEGKCRKLMNGSGVTLCVP